MSALPPGFELEPSTPEAPAPIAPGALPAGFELVNQPRPSSSANTSSWGEYLGGLARSALGGATFNFGDEIEGFIRSRLSGSKDYEAEVARIRDEMDQFKKANPWAATATELAAGFLVPGGVAAKAAQKGAGLMGAAKAGAKTGAAFGAASGIGAGEDLESRAVGGATGLAVGGAVGAVATPLIAGGIDTAKRAGRFVSSRMGNEAAQGERALEAYAGSLSRDAQNLKPGMSKQAALSEYADDIERGSRAHEDTLYNVAGPHTQALVQDSAATGNKSAAVAKEYVEGNRAARESSDPMAIEALSRGAPEYEVAKGRIKADMDNLAGPAYKTLYGQPAVYSQEINQLMKDVPVVRQAFAVSKAEKFKNTGRDVKSSASQLGFHSPEEIDHAQRKLRELAEKKFKNGDKEAADDLNLAREKLLDAFDTAYPDAAKIRQSYHESQSAMRLGDEARNVNPTVANEDIPKLIEKIQKATGDAKDIGLSGAQAAVVDKLKVMSPEKAARVVVENRQLREFLLGAFGPQAAGATAQAARRLVKTAKGEKALMDSAESGAKKGLNIDNTDLASVAADVTVSKMFGYVPVVTVINRFRKMGGLSDDEAKLVVKAATKANINGSSSMADLMRAVKAVDEKAAEKFQKTVARTLRTEQLVIDQPGEYAGENRGK